MTTRQPPMDRRARTKLSANSSLRECMQNPNTREQCIRRIIRHTGLHVTRTLDESGTQAKHTDWSLPEPPMPFEGVAGVILDRQRTRIIAVVMQNGSINKLKSAVFLPPELAEDRPEVGVDTDTLRRTLEQDDKARFNYSRPVMGGRMPVVTPATQPDLDELHRQVDKADDFPDESSFGKAIVKAREQFKKQPPSAPPAYMRGLVKVGPKMIPILDVNHHNVDDSISGDAVKFGRPASPSNAIQYDTDYDDDAGEFMEEECVGC